MDRNRPDLAHRRRPLIGLILALAWLACWAGAGHAQIPGLPSASKPAAAPKDDPTKKPVPAKGEPGTVFTATAKSINVNEKVDDPKIQATLKDLLNQFPGVRTAAVRVVDGVVTIDGQVDDDDTMDDLTAFAQKVDGVRLVLNKMKTDAETLTGREMAAKALGDYGRVVSKNWILTILAVAFALGFGFLARSFARNSETLLAPFLRNSLLRSVVGSVISSLIVLGGILLGLSILNLTHAVLSVLGLAGVAGLALGFAFRDIAENFIASMLLGFRRPFQIGDFLTVAGKSGSVLSLDTRATTLITPEGHYVRIPNAVIYKETMINASTSPSTLGSVEVVIPYEASTAEALEAINDALRATDGLLQSPTPRALVQALEPGGVRLHASYWMPSRGIDGDKLQSDLLLKIKVALQKAGITPPPTAPAPLAVAPAPVQVPAANEAHRSGPGPEASRPVAPAPAVAPDHRAEANLRKDAEAAEAVDSAPAEHQPSPIDHAIHKAEADAAAEGNNMLVSPK